MKMASHWIFNKQLDLLCFAIIPLLGFLFRYLFSSELLFQQVTFLVAILADNSHIYGSLFRVYGDPSEFRKYFKFYIILPLVLLSFILLMKHQAPEAYLIIFFTYSAMIHYFRQQYGWMRLSIRNQKLKPSENKFLSFAIYTFTLGPIVLLHLDPSRSWLAPGDLFNIPIFNQISPYIHALIVTSFFVFVMYCWKNRSKNLQSVFLTGSSTFVTWYLGVIVLQTYVPIILLHAAPYLCLSFRYGKRNLSTSNVSRSVRIFFAQKWWSFPLFYSLLVSLAFVKAFPKPSGLMFINLFGGTTALFHYVTDAIVWRISKVDNANVVQALGEIK